MPDIPEAAARLFLAERPRTVALAGGRTPRAVYARLATEQVDWSAMDVFFGDERCVPPDHPDSNFRMAEESLLSMVSARVHRMRGETCDAAGYEGELRSVFGPGVPAFELVFLGMGADGHTASLFPRDRALEEAERLVVRVVRPDHSRLTLTLPVLSASKLAVFLVSGAEKRQALQRVLAGEDLPAARVAARRVVIIADADAAPTGIAGGVYCACPRQYSPRRYTMKRLALVAAIALLVGMAIGQRGRGACNCGCECCSTGGAQ